MKNGEHQTRRVEVGLAGDQSTEIVSGLKKGDEVVTAVIEPVPATQCPPGFGGQGMPRGLGGGGYGGGRR